MCICTEDEAVPFLGHTPAENTHTRTHTTPTPAVIPFFTTRCNIHGNALQLTGTHWNTLEHTATHCNTLQHTCRHPT